MSPSSRISRQTRRGHRLEAVVADALRDHGLTRSPDVPRGHVRPDLFRAESPLAVCVTHTPPRNTFQKKRWRYVHEVFALRQAHPGLRAVELRLGPQGALTAADRAALGLVFDATVVLPAPEVPDGPIPALREIPAVRALQEAARAGLAEALAAPARHPELWALVARHAAAEALRQDLPEPRTPSTHLREVVYGTILVPEDRLVAVLDRLRSGRRLESTDRARLEAAGAPLVPRLGGAVPDPAVFRTTLRHGFPPEAVRLASMAARRSRDAAHVLADLRGPARVLELATHVRSYFPDRRAAFAEACAAEHGRAVATGTRHRLLDGALLAGGMSITWVDQELANRWGDLGHANRVQCTISARCPMRRSFTAEETARAALRVWDLLVARTDLAGRSPEALAGRMLAARRRSLRLLGGSLSPAEVLLSETLRERGLTPSRTSLPSALADLGLAGRGARVERLWRVGEAWVKVHSAHTGAEHKAEELAGRARLLRYRRGESGWRRDDLPLVLVTEGAWSRSALAAVARAGWDRVYALADVLADPKVLLT